MKEGVYVCVCVCVCVSVCVCVCVCVYLCVLVTQSCPTLRPHRLYSPWNSPGENTGVGSLSLLQGIFPIQGSNPGLPDCRQILYQLSHKENPEREELAQLIIFFDLVNSPLR